MLLGLNPVHLSSHKTGLVHTNSTEWQGQRATAVAPGVSGGQKEEEGSGGDNGYRAGRERWLQCYLRARTARVHGASTVGCLGVYTPCPCVEHQEVGKGGTDIEEALRGVALMAVAA